MAYTTEVQWEDNKDHKKIRDKERQAKGLAVCQEWADLFNIKLTVIQPWQIRLFGNGVMIDVWPTNYKYHNITLNKRGWYKEENLIPFLNTTFKTKSNGTGEDDRI